MISRLLNFLTGLFFLQPKLPDDNGATITVRRSKRNNRKIEVGPPAKKIKKSNTGEQHSVIVAKNFRKRSENTTCGPNTIQCLKTVRNTRAEMKKGFQDVQWNDQKLFQEAERSIRRQISDDPVLRKHLHREVQSSPNRLVTLTKCYQIGREFVFNTFGVNSSSGKNSSKGSCRKDGMRILLNKNITGKTNDPIGLYDHISKSPECVNMPETSSYLYTDRNILSKDLEALDNEFKKAKNIIRCDCHNGGRFVNCWENLECPCYKMNLSLRKIQVNGERYIKQNRLTMICHDTAKFSTFGPLHLNADHFWYSIGFACSEECGCRGCCSNNATYLVDKKINKFEVVRESELVGFKVRTLNYIPAGTVVFEFTGQMCSYKSINKEDLDYAFEVVKANEKTREKLIRILNARGKFKKLMKEAYSHTWFLNPKHTGNIARNLNHSCESNTTLIRVFQKGFSPSHVRYLAVTKENVFAGEELTYDYGSGYFENQLVACGCEKPTCVSSITEKLTIEFTEENLEEFKVQLAEETSKVQQSYVEDYTRRFENYKFLVLDWL